MAHTFTWKTSEGTTFDVEPDFDVDNWTGREMRTIERMSGGSFGTGFYSTMSLCFAVAIARQVPGYTIESADSELTFGRVRELYSEVKAKELAEQEADAAAAGESGEQGAAVLSPTRPDEQGGTPE